MVSMKVIYSGLSLVSHWQEGSIGVTGSRTRYPKIQSLDILTILSGRNLTNSLCWRTCWPSPKTGHETLMWEMPSTYPKENSLLPLRWEGCQGNLKEQHLLSFPQFTTLTSCPFSPITFSQDFLLFIKPSVKKWSGLTTSVCLHFLMKVFCVMYSLNRFVCLPLVNLSFVVGAPVENSRRKRFFSNLQ